MNPAHSWYGILLPIAGARSALCKQSVNLLFTVRRQCSFLSLNPLLARIALVGQFLISAFKMRGQSGFREVQPSSSNLIHHLFGQLWRKARRRAISHPLICTQTLLRQNIGRPRAFPFNRDHEGMSLAVPWVLYLRCGASRRRGPATPTLRLQGR